MYIIKNGGVKQIRAKDHLDCYPSTQFPSKVLPCTQRRQAELQHQGPNTFQPIQGLHVYAPVGEVPSLFQTNL